MRCGNGLPGFFDADDLAHAFQPPHLLQEYIDDNQGGHREDHRMVFDDIELENQERTAEKLIGIHLPVQQVVVFASPVVFREDKEKFVGIELDGLLLNQLWDIVPAKRVVAVKGAFGDLVRIKKGCH